jgi:large subunit ribosomal protein L3
VSFGILGNKVGMSQIFDVNGNIIPVTIIKAGPCFITQKKSIQDCGYNAIQIGFIEIKNINKVAKPLQGHFNKATLPPYRILKEFKVENLQNYQIGEELSTEIFKAGQKINISALTIGKGNASNIKKNNFSRGPMTHGSKHHRLQGSLGAGTTPGRVFPGKKMPGRLGMDKCTIKNLEIISVNKEANLVILKGNVPGKPGNLVCLSCIK